MFGAEGWGGVTTGVVFVGAMALCAAGSVVMCKGRGVRVGGVKGAAAALLAGFRVQLCVCLNPVCLYPKPLLAGIRVQLCVCDYVTREEDTR